MRTTIPSPDLISGPRVAIAPISDAGGMGSLEISFLLPARWTGDGHADLLRLCTTTNAAHRQTSATSVPLSEVVVLVLEPQVRWLQYLSVVAKTTSVEIEVVSDSPINHHACDLNSIA
jgi:hypothetical protein